jgi:SEC-C motif
MKIGRNEPCPCGSGKKFKKCCIDSAAPDARPAVGAAPPEMLQHAQEMLRLHEAQQNVRRQQQGHGGPIISFTDQPSTVNGFGHLQPSLSVHQPSECNGRSKQTEARRTARRRASQLSARQDRAGAVVVALCRFRGALRRGAGRGGVCSSQDRRRAADLCACARGVTPARSRVLGCQPVLCWVRF